MPTDIFLFPNSLVSSEELLNLGGSVVVSALQALQESCGEPVSLKIFDNEQLSGFATFQYEWMLLSGRNTLAPFAPFLWKGLGGSQIDKEIWALNPYKLENGKIFDIGDPFDLEEECLLVDFLKPIVRKFGFGLQTLNGIFFLDRKESWDVVVCPWPAQNRKAIVEAAGSQSGNWQLLMKTISSELVFSDINRYRKSKMKDPLSGLWVSGGGFDKPLMPCSQLRCVLTQDPFLMGLAEDCGIPKNFIRPITNNWPDCPEGNRLVVFEDFQPYKNNNQAWTEYWEKVINIINNLLKSRVGLPASRLRFVATNGLRASSIEKDTTSGKPFLGRFRTTKGNPQNAYNWLRPTKEDN